MRSGFKYSAGAVFLFFLLGSLPFLSVAQGSLNPFVLRTNNATVPFSAEVKGWLKNYAGLQSRQPVQVLLHFDELPVSDLIMALENNGIHLLNYFTDKTYSAVIYPAVNINTPFLSVIKHIAEVKPQWKADEYLWQQANTANIIHIIASFNKQAARADIEAQVKQAGGTLSGTVSEGRGIYKISLPGNKLKSLASWYNVNYISPAPEDQPLNFESKTASKANIAALPASFGGYGLTGAGVSIGVGDNTSGITHIDLKDRVINYNPTPYTNHGVHINGITGGAGIMDPKGEGTAPGATLVDHLFSAVWEQTGAMHDAHNMTITNNSYANVVGSCKYAGTYDVNSQAIDAMALQYKDVLHVFAAGNDGYLKCSPYPDGFATVNGGYQPAKNNIVVTSTNKRYVNASDGGRGPVKDGRLKPEITAVGVDVNSTTRKEEYLVASGTSMASPAVAGALGLLTERYRQINGNTNPRADVLKTIMLNGATDIGNPGPDYRFGFGFMNVYHSLLMLDSNRYTTNTAGNGGQQVFTFQVPPNTAQLKVMLCWHDAVGNPAAARALVNDLDLQVQDASSTMHWPLVLDTTAPNINNNAIEGVDRLNNCEQVTINNPTAGTCTAIIKGFSIPTGAQDYVLAYDFIPTGVQLTYPTTGAKVKASDSLRIYWDASDGSNNFTLEYSTDNGSNWSLIDNNIPAGQRLYVWTMPAGISSGKCRMRLSRNSTSEVFTTGSFAMNLQPVLKLDTIQCPGYIHVKWDPVANAAAYKMYRKIGPRLAEVGTTTATEYSFSGLSLDSVYYVAMSPVIDGLTGYRSLAIKRQPNDGSCDGSISDGDLMLQSIPTPGTGRKFTSTELKPNEPLTVLVRNLDDAPCNHYRISYSINNAPWQSQDYNTPVAAKSASTIKLADIDLSTAGEYIIRTAIENLLQTDLVPQNDSIVKTVRQLNNDVISLAAPFVENFETVPAITSIVNLQGLSPNDHWDYTHSTDTGRFRSFVNNGITLNGNRSISLDAFKSTPDNQNNLTGTFNLSNYHASADEIRLEFNYLLHGKPKFTEGNEVWIRGNDQQEWQSIFSYNTAVTGAVQNSGSLSVTDGLQKSSQDFSSSFQIKIGQHDSSVIAAKNYGNGMTFDDVSLYTVQNDLQLSGIVAPHNIECGAAITPLTITIRNSVNQPLSNVQLNYRLDDKAVVTETLPSITGKKEQAFTFSQKLDLSAPGEHTLDVWVNAPGDTYRKNDSVLNYVIHNQPLVATYPYFENFENDNGKWYSEGQNDSWEYGTPQAPKINKAYSGTKAWKTNLDGNYNDLENSYLYSPCFDISTLSFPTVSFYAAMDIENCGIVLCDAGFMDYTTDGVTWNRLDDMKKGINWYDDTGYHIWSKEDNTTWHEVRSPLPKGKYTIKLRFGLNSDQGGTREGIAVDDVRVYDDIRIAGNKVVGISPNPTHDGKVNITWAAHAGTIMQVYMTDIMGREVFRTSFKAEESYNQSTLQTTRFASGIYIMRIMIGDKVSEHKIVYE